MSNKKTVKDYFLQSLTINDKVGNVQAAEKFISASPENRDLYKKGVGIALSSLAAPYLFGGGAYAAAGAAASPWLKAAGIGATGAMQGAYLGQFPGMSSGSVTRDMAYGALGEGVAPAVGKIVQLGNKGVQKVINHYDLKTPYNYLKDNIKNIDLSEYNPKAYTPKSDHGYASISANNAKQTLKTRNVGTYKKSPKDVIHYVPKYGPKGGIEFYQSSKGTLHKSSNITNPLDIPVTVTMGNRTIQTNLKTAQGLSKYKGSVKIGNRVYDLKKIKSVKPEYNPILENMSSKSPDIRLTIGEIPSYHVGNGNIIEIENGKLIKAPFKNYPLRPNFKLKVGDIAIPGKALRNEFRTLDDKGVRMLSKHPIKGYIPTSSVDDIERASKIISFDDFKKGFNKSLEYAKYKLIDDKRALVTELMPFGNKITNPKYVSLVRSMGVDFSPRSNLPQWMFRLDNAIKPANISEYTAVNNANYIMSRGNFLKSDKVGEHLNNFLNKPHINDAERDKVRHMYDALMKAKSSRKFSNLEKALIQDYVKGGSRALNGSISGVQGNDLAILQRYKDLYEKVLNGNTITGLEGTTLFNRSRLDPSGMKVGDIISDTDRIGRSFSVNAPVKDAHYFGNTILRGAAPSELTGIAPDHVGQAYNLAEAEVIIPNRKYSYRIKGMTKDDKGNDILDIEFVNK